MTWRIGILYRVVDLLRLLHQEPRPKSEILTSFAVSRFRNVSIDDVLSTGFYGGWVRVDESDCVSCTTDGCNLLSLASAQHRLRCQIERILEKEDPLWASSAVQGRQALASYAPPEAVQCFREAGLLDGEDDEIVAWWDTMGSRFRAAREKVYVEIGRRGERLTFDLEKERTGRQPKWIALEYSNAGYDIISSISANDAHRLVIEVKTSVQPWNRADFYLSRAEWNTLIQEENPLVHLWSVCLDTPLHAAISISDLQQHIPSDRGDGVWHRCRVPFEAFTPQQDIHL